MTTINKQRFLAELGKLLTFMYEEDRQTALAMYAKMFDDAEDEQALLQALVSPTRQAVLVARSYNAKERKLQVQSQSREEDPLSPEPENTPEFMLVIGQIYDKAIPQRSSAAEPLADQFSLFEDNDLSDKAPEEAEADQPVMSFPDLTLENTEEAEVEPAEETAEEAEALSLEEEPASPAAEESSGNDAAAAPEAASEEAQAESDEFEDEVDAFLANFSLEDKEEAQLSPEAAPEEAADAEIAEGTDPEAETSLQEEAEPEEEDIGESLMRGPLFTDETVHSGATVRKAKTGLLILYILLAIPITLVLIALLLIPTAIFLGLAISVIAAGSATLMGAFSGFPVFADIILVLGAALIVLALGLLLLWIFVWFIGGPIVGLIRGAVSLGAKWCYEEVPA